MIQKTHKYRIYPNREQQELLEKHFGSVRWVYNWGLEKKVKSYQENKKRISCFDLIKELTKLKKIKDFQWLNEVNSQSLQMALRNLDNAFTNFFRKQNKFPRFKSKKNNKQSFQIPQRLKLNDKLNIPKIPNIKIKLSRKIEGKIKTATVRKTPTSKYFISILVEQNKELPLKPKIEEKTTVGIDFGIKTFATISDGRRLENPKFLDKSLKQLKRQQRWLSRKVKNSNNRNKQRLRVALTFEKISSQRSDFLHKFSYGLTHENQVESIAIEDLNVNGMVRNHYLARAIQDASWREARRQLAYKCDWYGRNFLMIGRFEPSSKICSCGTINHELTLVDREWTCPICGIKHDRDLLASQNIKKFALIGSGRPESTLVESRGSKAHSLKQESPDCSRGECQRKDSRGYYRKEELMQIKTDPKHLGFLVKTQLAIEKIRVAIQVRNTHLHLQNQKDLACEELQGMLKGAEDFIDKSVAEIMKTHPAAPWFSRVKGIGLENIAKVIGLVRVKPDPDNPEKKYAKTISSLWKFAGMHVENGKAPRAVRGKKLEFNKQLRSMAWRIGRSLCRARGSYYEYYLKQKAQYRIKFLERGIKIVPASELPYKMRAGRKIHYEPEEIISTGHLDNMAKRKMIKLFLAHIWLVWREAEGLPVTEPWVIAHGGHAHLIDPWEMVAAKKSPKRHRKELAAIEHEESI